MTIAELLKQSESLRDEAWEQQFLNQLPSLRFQVLEAQVQQGPDGWPYLFVEIQQDSEGGEQFSDIQNWLLNQGVGLAINPLRSPPDYVLPYGQLWLYQTTGKFVAEVKPRLKGGEPFAGPAGGCEWNQQNQPCEKDVHLPALVERRQPFGAEVTDARGGECADHGAPEDKSARIEEGDRKRSQRNPE